MLEGGLDRRQADGGLREGSCRSKELGNVNRSQATEKLRDTRVNLPVPLCLWARTWTRVLTAHRYFPHVVERASMTIEGPRAARRRARRLGLRSRDRHRAGRGRRRRHHGVAVSVRRSASAGGREGREAWWPALCAPDLIDPDALHGALSLLARATDRRGAASTILGAARDFGRRPCRPGRRVARRLRLPTRRSPSSAPASAAWSASRSPCGIPTAAES